MRMRLALQGEPREPQHHAPCHMIPALTRQASVPPLLLRGSEVTRNFMRRFSSKTVLVEPWRLYGGVPHARAGFRTRRQRAPRSHRDGSGQIRAHAGGGEGISSAPLISTRFALVEVSGRRASFRPMHPTRREGQRQLARERQR